MKKFIIEIEETRADAVVNLLATVNVKIGNVKPEEKKYHYVKLIANGYNEDKFLKLTEEQLGLLQYLYDEGFLDGWEDIEPEEIFEEV